MTQVLLLASKRAYQIDDFVRAAERLGLELTLGTDRCHVLAEVWPGGSLALDFRDAEAAAATIFEYARSRPVAGIVATDEITAVIAAQAARRLGLRANPPAAAQTAANKLHFRRVVSRVGLAQPGYVAVPADAELMDVSQACTRAGLDYPLVIKPLHLSASRGVMRVDSDAELVAGLARLAALLRDPEIAARDPGAARLILIESFVAGAEVAYEGLLMDGELRTLAIFDKPDPLDGPFFAETIYVTPSSQPAAVQAAIHDQVAQAAQVMGLSQGPVHAELRLSERGPLVLELAARAIGGLCTRTLRFGAGISLEELLLGHAVGRDVDEFLARETGAGGVYMLPVPAPGVVREVSGVDQALAMPGVRDAVITVRPGEHVVPLPEGNMYMGFLFAAGQDPHAVTALLRRAAACIKFRIAPML